MSKILVTGGAGFVGSHLVDALIDNNHEVVVVDDLSTGFRENVNPGATFYKEDICDRKAIFRVFRNELPDYVYHFAALARIQPSIKDPVNSHDVNVTGTLNILEACRRSNVVRVIFSGSSSLYEGNDLPTNEDSPLKPKNPYSIQKLICEQYIEFYYQMYGLDYVVFRYFNVYGPRQILTGRYAAVVGIFLQQHARKAALTINGDGTKRRDFTHVRDVTEANVMGLTLPTGVYNVGTGVNHSILEIANKISNARIHLPEVGGEVRETLADNSKLRKYGWQPTCDILDDWVLKEMADATQL